MRQQAKTVWDCLMEVGRPYAIRPAGMLALDMARLEAGLILIEVDYTSAKHALIPAQNYSPFEIGLGRLVNLDKSADFVGRRALEREVAAGGPARRLVGLTIDYQSIETLYEAQDLPIAVSTTTWREHRPVYVGQAPDRPRHERHVEPDAQAAHRARVGRARVRAGRLARRARVDRRGPARPRRGHGRATALLRPAAQARLARDIPRVRSCR